MLILSFNNRKHKTCFLQNPKRVSCWAFVKTGRVISHICLSSQMTEDQLFVSVWGFWKQQKRKKHKQWCARAGRRRLMQEKLWTSCVFEQIPLKGPLNSSVRAINPSIVRIEKTRLEEKTLRKDRLVTTQILKRNSETQVLLKNNSCCPSKHHILR